MPNVRPHLRVSMATWRRTKLHCSPLLIKVDSCDAMFCSYIEPHLTSPKMRSAGSIRRAIVNSMNKATSVGLQCSITTPMNPGCQAKIGARNPSRRHQKITMRVGHDVKLNYLYSLFKATMLELDISTVTHLVDLSCELISTKLQ